MTGSLHTAVHWANVKHFDILTLAQCAVIGSVLKSVIRSLGQSSYDGAPVRVCPPSGGKTEGGVMEVVCIDLSSSFSLIFQFATVLRLDSGSEMSSLSGKYLL